MIEHLAFVVVFLPVQMEQGVRYLVRHFHENIRLDKGIVVPFQINYQLLSVILNFPDTVALSPTNFIQYSPFGKL